MDKRTAILQTETFYFIPTSPSSQSVTCTDLRKNDPASNRVEEIFGLVSIKTVAWASKGTLTSLMGSWNLFHKPIKVKQKEEREMWVMVGFGDCWQTSF